MALHVVVERPALGVAFVRVQPWTGNYARLTPEQAHEQAAAIERAADEAARHNTAAGVAFRGLR